MARKSSQSGKKSTVKSASRGSSTRKTAAKRPARKLSTISRAMSKSRGSKRRKPGSKQATQKNFIKASTRVTLVRKKARGAVKAVPVPQPSSDLPFSYDQTKLILLARDPFWAYTYWDFSGETWHWIQDLRHHKNGLRAVLRVRNLKDESFFDIDIQLETKNWYIHIGMPDVDCEAELGIIDSAGKYYLIVRSNRIHMPRNRPSEEIDADWHPEFFDEIYQLSGGGKTGRSSDVSSQFRKRSS